MAAAAVIALILLCKRLEAAPVPDTPASNRPCVDFMLPVTVTAQNVEYNIVHVNNNIDAVAYAVDLDTWSSPSEADRVIRNITVSDAYNISTQLCIPPDGSKQDHLQIATHGLFFDKRYWDVGVNPSEYSYVDAALAAGYSILTYDRLGTGLSDKPDAYTVVQTPLQLEILRGITEMARSGQLLQYATGITQSNVSFDKIIQVGHSLGSSIVAALLTTYAALSDGAVFTGFLMNEHLPESRRTEFGLEYAAENDPVLFGDRSSGYMVAGTRSAIQTGFFSTNATSGIGGFEPELLEYGFSVRQTLTGPEFVLPSRLDLGPAEDFEGPVQFVLGEFDFINCRGDCNNVADPTLLRSLYPKAKPIDMPIDVYIQPGTGHGLTMHRGATLGYKATLDWLDMNGL